MQANRKKMFQTQNEFTGKSRRGGGGPRFSLVTTNIQRYKNPNVVSIERHYQMPLTITHDGHQASFLGHWLDFFQSRFFRHVISYEYDILHFLLNRFFAQKVTNSRKKAAVHKVSHFLMKSNRTPVKSNRIIFHILSTDKLGKQKINSNMQKHNKLNYPMYV